MQDFLTDSSHTNNILAKKELIFERSNLFDPITLDFIERSIIQCPLSYGHTAWPDNDQNKFFGRVFYWDTFQESFNATNIPSGVDYVVDYVINHAIHFIHPDTTLDGIQRVLINGQTMVNEPSVHIDQNSLDHWSILYYVTKNGSGGTMIYDNIVTKNHFHLCDYEQGKFLIFPSTYAHQALPPIEKDHWRMTLNVVVKVNTPIRNLIVR